MSTLTERDKITVLIAEYNTLRAEIIQRYGSGFQLIAVSVPSIALFNVLSNSNWKWAFVLLAAVVIGGASYMILAGIRHVSAHLRTLERRINALAGDDLLQWEALTHKARKRCFIAEIGRDIKNRKVDTAAAPPVP